MTRIGLGIVLGTLTLACASASKYVKPPEGPSVDFPLNDSIKLSGNLSRPEGNGPFPAIVLMPDCPGVEAMQLEVARLLNDAGYVTLVVDSLSGRHVRDLCDDPFHKSPTSVERVEDAFAARRYLSSLPFVDSDHIGMVGWAHGGTTALIAWTHESYYSAAAGTTPFAAVAAYYPYCGGLRGSSGSPLLILTGDADDWCPAGDCMMLVQSLTVLGRDASIMVYPGATHRFDASFPSGIHQGHRYARDAAAERDSHERLLALFNRTLKT